MPITAMSSHATPARRFHTSLAFLLLIGLCITFLIANSNAAHGAGSERLRVGLVNEDLAGEFNGETYTLGSSFVDRISKDSQYNWIVLSRAVAEKAYRDGSVDALLYIPQTFTRDILTFQDASPTKTTVEYKLEPQTNKQEDQLLESKVLEIVHGFNESVSTMYYASLADNLAEANDHMNGSLTNQKALITAITQDVQQPFSDALPQIQNFISSATGLKGVNDATVKAHNSFTQAATDFLTANANNLNDQLPSINEYFQRQLLIGQINTTNSNAAIVAQANSDRETYKTQFDSLKNNVLCALSGIDSSDPQSPCDAKDVSTASALKSIIGGTKQVLALYTGKHIEAVNSLYADIDARIQNLKTVKTLLTASGETTEPNNSTEPTEQPETVDPPTPEYVTDPAIIALLETEIEGLESTRDSLSSLLPAPTFDTSLSALDAWYNAMVEKTTSAALTPNSVNRLEITDWSTYRNGGAGLYADNSDELHISLSGLVTRGVQTEMQIAKSAASVPDNTPLFDALLQDATTTYNSSGRVFTGLGSLSTVGVKNTSENEAYYKNFSTILANTRASGINTKAIYAFLSAPIEAQNISPVHNDSSNRTNQNSWLDLRGIVIFGGGLLLGLLLTTLSHRVRKRKNT